MTVLLFSIYSCFSCLLEFIDHCCNCILEISVQYICFFDRVCRCCRDSRAWFNVLEYTLFKSDSIDFTQRDRLSFSVDVLSCYSECHCFIELVRLVFSCLCHYQCRINRFIRCSICDCQGSVIKFDVVTFCYIFSCSINNLHFTRYVIAGSYECLTSGYCYRINPVSRIQCAFCLFVCVICQRFTVIYLLIICSLDCNLHCFSSDRCFSASLYRLIQRICSGSCRNVLHCLRCYIRCFDCICRCQCLRLIRCQCERLSRCNSACQFICHCDVFDRDISGVPDNDCVCDCIAVLECFFISRLCNFKNRSDFFCRLRISARYYRYFRFVRIRTCAFSCCDVEYFTVQDISFCHSVFCREFLRLIRCQCSDCPLIACQFVSYDDVCQCEVSVVCRCDTVADRFTELVSFAILRCGCCDFVYCQMSVLVFRLIICVTRCYRYIRLIRIRACA